MKLKIFIILYNNLFFLKFVDCIEWIFPQRSIHMCIRRIWMYLRIKYFEKAKAEIENALEIDPGCDDILYLQSQLQNMAQ